MNLVSQHYHRPAAPRVSPDKPMILMIDSSRRLLDCTPEAVAMLERRDPLLLEFGRVAMSRQQDADRLGEALRAATLSGAATLSIGEDAMQIEAVRFGEARLLLVCRRRSADLVQCVEETADSFGLTAAERRLLGLLSRGMSLPGAATSLGVARTTARTHLQRIFDKTGSRRQADLMRLVTMGSAQWS